MKLTKVHKAMSFTQSAWLKPYIDYNTTQRAKSTNDFEKDFYKLMNNAVFGKTMENVFKRMNFKLINNVKQLTKYTRRPTFKHKVDISPDQLVGVEMEKETITLDKNVSVGFSVLELSKVLMYDFYYNKLKKQYGEKVTLCYTDTDSFIIEIQTDDLYEDLKDMADDFDFSDYPANHPCFDKKNKKVIGKFKDELCGTIMTEFVGLKSKMYSFMVDQKQKHRAKGVNRAARKHLNHELYKKCIQEIHVEKGTQMNTFRSFKHQIFSLTLNKTSLTSYDDKRYMLDSINSYAYGHYKIKS